MADEAGEVDEEDVEDAEVLVPVIFQELEVGNNNVNKTLFLCKFIFNNLIFSKFIIY